jgi:hypothetical protein
MNKTMAAVAVTGLMALASAGLIAGQTREQAAPQTPGQSASPAQEPVAKPEAKPAAPRTAEFTVAVRGGYFAPSEAAFKDVYGGGFAFGAEITAQVWKGLSTWIEGGLFSKNGRMTYTGETTKVRITPFGLGLDYEIGHGRWRAYAGAGLSYYDFRETNVIGDVSSGGMGWKARAGAKFRFAKRLFADARLSFSRCDIEPSGIKVDIGGLELGLGLGYLF